MMETAVKELGVECVGDCSERVRGGVMETAVKELGGSVCETETAMKELGVVCMMETAVKELGVECVGDCSESVKGCVMETAAKELGVMWVMETTLKELGGGVCWRLL